MNSSVAAIANRFSKLVAAEIASAEMASAETASAETASAETASAETASAETVEDNCSTMKGYANGSISGCIPETSPGGWGGFSRNLSCSQVPFKLS